MMFIPKNAEELEQAVLSGNLEETTVFDVKRDLPSSKKNLDIAIDIAAMTVDGGVIIYGIDEDQDGCPTILSPLDNFRNQKERIDQIIRTCIVEPPTIHIEPIPSSMDSSKGYLVVVVPQSERAPHMVIAKNEYCYYGRTSSGNFKLTEGQVAQLYQRRMQWEVDRNSLLEQEIAKSPYKNVDKSSYLHVVVKPIGTHNDFMKNVMSENEPYRAFFYQEFTKVFQASLYPNQGLLFYNDPEFTIEPSGYKFRFGYYSQDIESQLDILIDDNGMGHLFWGRAATVIDNTSNQLQWHHHYTVDIVVCFLSLMADIYTKGFYFGNVDIGLAITGVKGVRSYPSAGHQIRAKFRTYPEDIYKCTVRKSRMELQENPLTITIDLLKRFADVLTNGVSQWMWPKSN
ncbi:MAG: ATP-binding protein [Chloroflexi bacterium]|nr:ATP-binding protein [Chloroflexota bacterium]